MRPILDEHCAECHAPRNRLGALRDAAGLRGGWVGVEGWIAPSLADLGLCSDPDPNRTVDTDESTNTYEDIYYHNVQAVYSVEQWNADVGFGVLNLFDQDPPTSYSAFANSASSNVCAPKLARFTPDRRNECS